MLHEAVEAADDPGDPDLLASALASLLAKSIADAGTDRIVAETDVDADIIEALVDPDGTPVESDVTSTESSGTSFESDEAPITGITLEEAAAVFAVTDGRSADDVVFEVRDHLLMGMTTAVLDVDSIAAAIDADLTGQEIQQAIEGRAAMTLAELAGIAAVIEDRKP